MGHGPYPSVGPDGGISPQVQQWFRAVDKDQSGFITSVELKQALVNAQGAHFSDTACNLMLGMFDKDRNGQINIEEFDKLYTYINQWLTVFKTYDTDQSGHIDETELTKGMFDKDRNGQINIEEFDKLYTYINQWLTVFKTYDTDQSGHIDETELTKALTQMGFHFTPDFISFAVKKCDSKEGKVSVDNFIVLCIQIQRFTEAFRVRDTQRNGTVTIGFEDFLTLALSCSV